MENINVTMGIDGDALEKLAIKIVESIDIEDHINMTRIVDDRIEAYDFDSVIENFSFRSIVNDIIEEYDFDPLMINILDDNQTVTDVNYDVEHLLESYSPTNTCSIGESFTEAVCKAVRYLLLKDEDFVIHIAKALEKLEKKKMMEEVRESVKEELKPLMFDSFKAELERYAAQMEKQKALALLGQYDMETIVLGEVTPWTRENDIGY